MVRLSTGRAVGQGMKLLSGTGNMKTGYTCSITLMLMLLMFLSTANSVLGCNRTGTLRLFDANWQHDVFDCLQNQTSVDLSTTINDEDVAATSNGDHPAHFRHIVPLCDQVERIGQGLLEYMIMSASAGASPTSANSLSLIVEDPVSVSRELRNGQQQNISLCITLPSSNRIHGGFSIEEVEYTTTGGSLTGCNLSLVLRTDLADGSVTVALPDHDIPQGEYYVRSYILLASEGNSTEEPFCKDMGMAMVMYMRGFHMSTRSSKKLLPCLNFLFGTWVLRDRDHFNGAMVYSFLLALLTQSLSAVRAVVVRHVTTKRTRKILLVIIYTVQQFLGYMIMLVAMMYSVELLFAVVGGVALGNRIFVKGDLPDFRRRRRRANNAELRQPLLEPTTEQ
mmetsp:Transcript_4352/g.7283  ORF Transcript_4352/g.7283 Transcript_4352/m.7283 type:complete len:394 (-) Transcript_4352:29-1210(-)